VLKEPPVDVTRGRLEAVEAPLRPASRGELAVDPALLALLSHERERCARIVRDGPERRPVAAALRTLKRRLYPYQRAGGLLTTQRIIANGLAQLRFQDTWPTLSALTTADETLQELASPKLGHLREMLTQVVVQQSREPAEAHYAGPPRARRAAGAGRDSRPAP
jgi:hypothetical protein